MVAEKIANLYIQSSTWKLINRVDLSQMMNTGPKILEYITTALKDCEKPCFIRTELMDQSTRLEFANIELEKIIHQINVINKTKRQAPIPFVGGIFRALFGLLSETDMTILQAMSQQSMNHSSSVAQILHNTTHILHSEISNITKHSKTLERELNKLKISVERIHYDKTLHLIVHQLQEIITQYRISTSMLGQAISLAHLGVLYPALFDEQKLITAINFAQLEKLNAKFPLNMENFSLNNIARISNIKIAIKGNDLIYFIEIPLIDYNSMNLYKIAPFPTINPFANDSITAYIIPENSYISMSQDNKSYMTPSGENIRNCKDIEKTWICINTPPVLRVTNNSRCEIKILAGMRYNPNECGIKLKKLRESMFMKLQGNSWIFTNPKGDQITVECHQKADTTIELPPMGVIS